MLLPALIYLACLPHLASFTTDRYVRRAEVHELLAGAPPLLSLFHSLQRLTLWRESAAVSPLPPHLARLHHLALLLLDERPWTRSGAVGRSA